jgi:hypothetical protein
MANITVSKWMPFRRNTLRGFAEGNFGPSLTISDVPVHTKNGRSWASLPSKPMISAEGTVLRDPAGKIRYSPVLSWVDKAAGSRFSDAVVAEITRLHGDAVLGDV